MNKRVLVLSHNAFSQIQNNGKTLESFFHKWDKDCLAQIYLQPEAPDFSFCENYFCISDYEVLNYYLTKGKIGKSVTPKASNIHEENLGVAIKALFRQKSKNRGQRKGLNRYIHNKFVQRKPAFVFIREMMWSYAKWKTEEFMTWIKDFNPEILFFQGSSCSFAYKIAEHICDTFQIPLVLELTDDYTYYQYRYSLFEKINKTKYLEAFEKGIKSAKSIITISSYMEKEYKKRFGGNYTVLLNSIDDPCIAPKKIDGTIKLLYAGNVSINRWKTLLAIGEAINQINKKSYGVLAQLYIYTPTQIDEKILARFNKLPSIVYGGSLNKKELHSAFTTADILVHVESFDEKMKKITRLSISTKIPEYLATNRCVLAVGPKDIASMKYLTENNAAVISNSVENEELKSILEKIFIDDELRNACIVNARALYEQNHQLENACLKIKEIIDSALEDGLDRKKTLL